MKLLVSLRPNIRLIVLYILVICFTLIVMVSSSFGTAVTDPLPLQILLPLGGALFPFDIAPPIVSWKDNSGASLWKVKVVSELGGLSLSESATHFWRPSADQWIEVKRLSLERAAAITIEGFKGEEIVSRGTVAFSTSRDPVSAPIFYREVVLPVAEAMAKPAATRWRVGDISNADAPRMVLDNVKICANCHAFTPDGKTIGMDIDTGGDKGAYVITDIGSETIFSKDKVITWNDFRREQGGTSYGLFSQFSPDGRYVVSTVKELPVFSLLSDIGYSQLFFPVRGILAVYDRQTKRFFPLPGADDPEYVQTNPVFSPDGKWIVFAMAKAIRGTVDQKAFIRGATVFRYDLYRILFNEGRGGKAEPLAGASNNDRSNYFPKFTPDGRWIVYTQSESFMIIQPDAELHIVPSAGGEARRLNLSVNKKMASWHSISPSGKWLVFSSKANGPYTQLWLTHLNNEGRESVPVLLDWFTPPDRAANIPEFLNIPPEKLTIIKNGIVY